MLTELGRGGDYIELSLDGRLTWNPLSATWLDSYSLAYTAASRGRRKCAGRGEPKATLGEVLKRNPGLLPKPLDTTLAQVWGYASNEARHVEEGREPSREEVELPVGLAAVVATYLTKK